MPNKRVRKNPPPAALPTNIGPAPMNADDAGQPGGTNLFAAAPPAVAGSNSQPVPMFNLGQAATPRAAVAGSNLQPVPMFNLGQASAATRNRGHRVAAAPSGGSWVPQSLTLDKQLVCCLLYSAHFINSAATVAVGDVSHSGLTPKVLKQTFDLLKGLSKIANEAIRECRSSGGGNSAMPLATTNKMEGHNETLLAQVERLKSLQKGVTSHSQQAGLSGLHDLLNGVYHVLRMCDNTLHGYCVSSGGVDSKSYQIIWRFLDLLKAFLDGWAPPGAITFPMVEQLKKRGG